MIEHYILDDEHKPVRLRGTHEEVYKQLFDWEMSNPEGLFVKKTYFGTNDNIEVSTVFLTINYNPFPFGLPMLWETMIFGGIYEGVVDRYSSYEEAMQGHETMCNMVKESLSNDQTQAWWDT